MMEAEKIEIKISVRNLVEFILRSGDIDNRQSRSAQAEAMQAGSRIHKKIQRSMGSGYRAEVPLRIEWERERYIFVIEGRADGIMDEDVPCIDEIKGVYKDLEYMEEPIEVHLAQAKCYAFIYALQNAYEQIDVQMTYCNLDTEDIKRFREHYVIEDLRGWFENLVEEYRKWADWQYEWRMTRKESIQSLPFPFAYREGQKELAQDIYRTIYREKTVFVQAPTGVGKTLSTVYPAVKAVGEGLADKIFYLTAKSITAKVAVDAVSLLQAHGYCTKTVVITAKEKMCLCEEMECNPEKCPYAKGHFDRVNDAVFDLLQTQEMCTREVFLQQAKEHMVCPFELCLDTATWADNIICDYNYVFDPNVYLRRFFAEGVKGEYLFLIDEAHNLIERGREMYSATLVKEEFLRMKKIIKPYSAKLAAELEKCNKILLRYKKECEGYRVYENITDIVFGLMRFGTASENFLQKNIEFADKKDFLEFYLNIRHFLAMYERKEENYVNYSTMRENGEFCFKRFCVDPSANIQECLDKGRSSVFFSATLLPINYYKRLLSTREDNYAIYAHSTFTPEQSCYLVANNVSSKYTRRTNEEYQKIATYIRKTVRGKKGNYMVFCPSYQFMEAVYEAFLAQNTYEVDCIVQGSHLTEAEREGFLAEFERNREKSLVGFCVLGGIFAEGIDLKQDSLIGVIVVGTGLPQVGKERELLKDYFDKMGDDGFDYAYRYPGMNKVQQAAGRVIRTAEDKGVIVLLDERFLQRANLSLFPREWSHYQVVNEMSLEEALKKFWENGQNS